PPDGRVERPCSHAGARSRCRAASRGGLDRQHLRPAHDRQGIERRRRRAGPAREAHCPAHESVRFQGHRAARLGSEESMTSPSATDGTGVPTILVVDDTPMNLSVLVRILEGSGYRILVARSGAAALDIARQTRPDLMLLDVAMPEMGGFDVCRALKEDP